MDAKRNPRKKKEKNINIHGRHITLYTKEKNATINSILKNNILLKIKGIFYTNFRVENHKREKKKLNNKILQ